MGSTLLLEDFPRDQDPALRRLALHLRVCHGQQFAPAQLTD